MIATHKWSRRCRELGHWVWVRLRDTPASTDEEIRDAIKLSQEFSAQHTAKLTEFSACGDAKIAEQRAETDERERYMRESFDEIWAALAALKKAREAASQSESEPSA